MSASISISDALNHLDILREFIDNDITAAINGNANYLAALGLSAYTEYMGGLYCGNLTTQLGVHYITFINKFFPSNYKKVEADLRANSLHGLYSVVRSGLTHEYFIKEISKIEMDSPSGQSLSCGIVYNKTSYPQIVFYVNQYFKDFKGAFEQYYEQLKYDTSMTMLQNFEKALQSVNSSLINKLHKDFCADVSGNRI